MQLEQIYNSKKYKLPDIFFKKYWFWFCDPVDIEKTDMVNFFSYNDVDAPGFSKKRGLTSLIDLSKSLEEIWSNMRQKFICKQIEKGQKQGIIIRQDNNFKEFKNIYNYFRKNKKLTKDSYSTFVKNGILFSAYYKNKMIAGGVFISDGINIRAWVLASKRHINDNRQKEIIGQANRMLIWEAIKYAKNNNYKIFDFGGISLDSKDSSQISLTEFKEGFGGYRRKCYYYHKVYSKFLNFLIKLRR